MNDENGTWSNYNDSSVTENVDPKEVVSAEAYVLYYRRRDVGVGQDKEYRFLPSPRHTSAMICEPVESSMDQRSVLSDTAVGDDDAISNASTSPMGSVDNSPQQEEEDDLFGDADEPQEDRRDFPLQ